MTASINDPVITETRRPTSLIGRLPEVKKYTTT